MVDVGMTIEKGVISAPLVVGGNSLSDSGKAWRAGVFTNHLIRVTRQDGAVEVQEILGNSFSSLVINEAWRLPFSPGSQYEILAVNLMQAIRDTLGGGVDINLAALIAGISTSLRPIERALQHNVAVVGGADILGAALAPTNTPCLFRVEVAFNAAGVFSVRLTNGGVTVGEEFNHGVVLIANSLFRFSHLVHAGDTINYRYGVNATMLSMRVQEVPAAA